MTDVNCWVSMLTGGGEISGIPLIMQFASSWQSVQQPRSDWLIKRLWRIAECSDSAWCWEVVVVCTICSGNIVHESKPLANASLVRKVINISQKNHEALRKTFLTYNMFVLISAYPISQKNWYASLSILCWRLYVATQGPIDGVSPNWFCLRRRDV